MRARSCSAEAVAIMSDIGSAAVWQPPSLRVVNSAADKLTFEQELKQARLQGYQDGLKQGQEEGRQQARLMLSEMSSLWDAMQQPFEDMEHDVHSELLGLTVAVAEAVLRRELTTDKELVRQSLASALNALGTGQGTVEVHLNPKDANLIGSLLDDDAVDHRIRTDPNIMPGGCRLHRGHALVDATVEAMILEAIAKISDRARLTDDQGNETARPLDAEEIQAIARRFSGDGNVD